MSSYSVRVTISKSGTTSNSRLNKRSGGRRYTLSMRALTLLLTLFSVALAADSTWEEKFRAIPDPHNMRDSMQRMSAHPHHVGSPYDKDNAEWLLAKFKEWGFDAHIESFSVLFPTPKERLVEL